MFYRNCWQFRFFFSAEESEMLNKKLFFINFLKFH